MTTETQEIGLFFVCVIAVLGFVTYIDFVVHYTLYFYGLQFSFEWAIPYWSALNLTFVSAGLLAAASYWIKREETLRHKVTAALLWISVYLTSLNLDILWFVFAGNLPPLGEVWWWHPFCWLFNVEWTTIHQIVFTLIIDIILVFSWVSWSIWMIRRRVS